MKRVAAGTGGCPSRHHYTVHCRTKYLPANQRFSSSGAQKSMGVLSTPVRAPSLSLAVERLSRRHGARLVRGYGRRIAAQLPQGRLLPDAVWRRRHRSITVLLWLHVPALLAFAIVRGYGVVHSTSEMLLVISLAIVASMPRLGRGPRSAAGGARPRHVLGAADPLLGGPERGALPLLRRRVAADPLPGLAAVPHRGRLRRPAPRRARLGDAGHGVRQRDRARRIPGRGR